MESGGESGDDVQEGFILVLKAHPLCTGAELNFGGRVLGEVEKNSFIALPGKGGHSGLVPLKIVCPEPGGIGDEFYSSSSRVGWLTRLACVQGVRSSNLVSGGLLVFSEECFIK